MRLPLQEPSIMPNGAYAHPLLAQFFN